MKDLGTSLEIGVRPGGFEPPTDELEILKDSTLRKGQEEKGK